MQPPPLPNDPLAQARTRLGGSLLTTGCGVVLMAIPAVIFTVFLTSMALEGEDALVPIVAVVFLLPFAGLLIYLAWSALRALRGIIEISNQQLASTPGEVVWTGRRYAVQAEGLSLRMLPGVELMPGRYALTYLPGTGFVVEAKPTSGADREVVTSALGAVFKFTSEDLTALRNGQLAPDHRARLQGGLRQGVLWALLGAAGFAALGLLVASVVSDAEGTGLALCVPAVAVAVVLIIVAASNGRQVQALDRGEVGMVEGPVREWTSGGRSRSYWFDVAGKRFRVGPEAHTALVQGQTYRLYFLKGNNQILALEPISPP